MTPRFIGCGHPDALLVRAPQWLPSETAYQRADIWVRLYRVTSGSVQSEFAREGQAMGSGWPGSTPPTEMQRHAPSIFFSDIFASGYIEWTDPGAYPERYVRTAQTFRSTGCTEMSPRGKARCSRAGIEIWLYMYLPVCVIDLRIRPEGKPWMLRSFPANSQCLPAGGHRSAPRQIQVT